MTYIDESLARGLASRFLAEANDRVNTIINCINKIDPNSSTKKGWLIKHRKLAGCARRAAFNYFELGTKSKPAIAFIGVTPEQHHFKSWEERCLTGQVLMFQYDSSACSEPEPIPFVISHHAIARLFMRCPNLKGMTESWDYERLLTLMQPLLSWSVVWDACVKGARCENFRRIEDSRIPYRFSPVIPSPYGLFFCETSYSDQRVNVRTFVGNDQLRDEQRELQKVLWDVQRGFEDLPVSLHPWTFFSGIQRTEIYILLFIDRLVKHAPLVSKFVCDGLTNEELAALEELGFLSSSTVEDFDPFGVEPQRFFSGVLKRLQELERERRNHKSSQ